MTKHELYKLLDEALKNPTEVYIGNCIEDAVAYINRGKEHLLASRVEPRWIEVPVLEQGRSCGIDVDTIAGYLLAEANGYWLIYVPDTKEFHIAWGQSENYLQAAGFFGKDPLGIWLD